MSETPDTFTTLKRTPGMSPTAWPLRPKPAMSTSSCRTEIDRIEAPHGARAARRRVRGSGGRVGGGRCAHARAPTAAAAATQACGQCVPPVPNAAHRPADGRSAAERRAHQRHRALARARAHVLVDKVQAAVVGHERGNLLAVLDQLRAHALADRRVGLLGLNANLLEHDALAVRRTAKRVALELRAEVGLLVPLGRPALLAPIGQQLAPSADSTRLAHACGRDARASARVRPTARARRRGARAPRGTEGAAERRQRRRAHAAPARPCGASCAPTASAAPRRRAPSAACTGAHPCLRLLRGTRS